MSCIADELVSSRTPWVVVRKGDGVVLARRNTAPFVGSGGRNRMCDRLAFRSVDWSVNRPTFGEAGRNLFATLPTIRRASSWGGRIIDNDLIGGGNGGGRGF